MRVNSRANFTETCASIACIPHAARLFPAHRHATQFPAAYGFIKTRPESIRPTSNSCFALAALAGCWFPGSSDRNADAFGIRPALLHPLTGRRDAALTNPSTRRGFDSTFSPLPTTLRCCDMGSSWGESSPTCRNSIPSGAWSWRRRCGARRRRTPMPYIRKVADHRQPSGRTCAMGPDRRLSSIPALQRAPLRGCALSTPRRCRLVSAHIKPAS